jgi:hypothetical protein
MPNFDEKSGIRYGVISPHAISPYALDDVYQNGTDPHYKAMCDELRVFAGDMAGQSPYPISEDLQEKIADLLIEDIGENFENPDGQMDYSDKEYDLHVSEDNFGIFVMRSPYYTYCRGCSPCAPGAGDLNSPTEITNEDDGTVDSMGKMTLCLDSSWFENNKAPYRVFRVDNDQEVI